VCHAHGGRGLQKIQALPVAQDFKVSNPVKNLIQKATNDTTVQTRCLVFGGLLPSRERPSMSKDRSPLELLSALAVTYVAGFLSASLLWMYADHVEQKAPEARGETDAASPEAAEDLLHAHK